MSILIFAHFFLIMFISLPVFQVKSELDRVKSCMQKLKEVELKNTKHPRVNQRAAKRFVKSSLWTPNQEESKKPKHG